MFFSSKITSALASHENFLLADSCSSFVKEFFLLAQFSLSLSLSFPSDVVVLGLFAYFPSFWLLSLLWDMCYAVLKVSFHLFSPPSPISTDDSPHSLLSPECNDAWSFLSFLGKGMHVWIKPILGLFTSVSFYVNKTPCSISAFCYETLYLLGHLCAVWRNFSEKKELLKKIFF